MPDELRDRRAVFGYIIDKEMLANCYSKRDGIQDLSGPDIYFDTLAKDSLAQDAPDAAGCSMIIVSKTPRRKGASSEEIVFAYFASYNPPVYYNLHPPH